MNVSTPKIAKFLMVPVTSNEILFLGGSVQYGRSDEVSVLDLVNLKLKIVANDPDYRFISSTASFSVSKSNEIHAVV